jgi:N-acetylglutamate synthase-like GNAT family acetyltransferase
LIAGAEVVPRPAAAADTPGVHALVGAIFAEYGYTLDVTNEDPHLGDPGACFRATGGEFWVLDGVGRVLGCCGVWLHADAGELKALYVAREIRRQGWGRAFCRVVFDHIRAAGLRRVFLWSDTRFEDAHRLYERVGFVRTGRRDMAVTNVFSEYRYERSLPP